MVNSQEACYDIAVMVMVMKSMPVPHQNDVMFSDYLDLNCVLEQAELLELV